LNNYLDKAQADEIVKGMIQKNLQGSSSLEEYLNQKNVSSEDLPLIMSRMVDIDYDNFSYFVFKIIREKLASFSASPYFKKLIRFIR
jgi:hypothetical protein